MYQWMVDFLNNFGLLQYVPSDTVSFIQWFIIVMMTFSIVRYILSGFYKLCSMISPGGWK